MTVTEADEVSAHNLTTSLGVSYDVGPQGEQFPRRVIKGGSHLYAPNTCLRYRPSARQAQTMDTSMAHLGFRCVV